VLAGCLEPATVIALNGPLGVGKTCFVKGLAAGLDVEEEVTSPTYTLAVPYSGRLELVHIDAYRLQSAAEVNELGLDELVGEGAVLAIEWHARFPAGLPTADLEVQMGEHGEAEGRRLSIIAAGPLGCRVLACFQSRWTGLVG
jgi:tRNA threonylcarbamoyladenosine biosynthesis protein TsaE